MLLNQNDLEGQTPQPIVSCTAIPNTDERHRGRWQREILEAGVSSRSRSVLLAIWPSWRPRRRERPAGPAASLHRPANRRAHVTEGLGSSRRRPGLRGCADDVGRVGGGDWQPDARQPSGVDGKRNTVHPGLPDRRRMENMRPGFPAHTVSFLFFVLSRLTGRCSPLEATPPVALAQVAAARDAYERRPPRWDGRDQVSTVFRCMSCGRGVHGDGRSRAGFVGHKADERARGLLLL